MPGYGVCLDWYGCNCRAWRASTAWQHCRSHRSWSCQRKASESEQHDSKTVRCEHVADAYYTRAPIPTLPMENDMNFLVLTAIVSDFPWHYRWRMSS
ncbi:hypothetical protein GLOTRDRAFT_112563 [Gloeophyllum trabeum ATCC 11539]|uniref:Uncharacterized protein n=1 Tax=Gloeophyllum trabeum (strain ATCC 11539 / FP-39264 / Madison 617) TaxID=670483 RepID=S7RA38_GLOTA|nr:uncharacterized protein GLOTRDRAFT_112563 [Gloeophyllum trabeum ATCC 11539]EPQ51125.1 hypothetical protein GLOTRDRAFT_112563 [Gloeophyllum trabeum ATCC 11539]